MEHKHLNLFHYKLGNLLILKLNDQIQYLYLKKRYTQFLIISQTHP